MAVASKGAPLRFPPLKQLAIWRAHNGCWPDHPTFGSLTGRAWGALMYRRNDHHFRQFGI
jgi:hypothetical protein